MKRLTLVTLLCLILCGCTNADINEICGTATNGSIPQRIATSLDGGDTRIELNNNLETVWSAGDAVSVFYKSNANNKYRYSGETGAKSGELVLETQANGTQTMSDIVAIYPYSNNYELNIPEQRVKVTLPSTQHYINGTYGLGENLMLYSGTSDNFSFKSVCGWLRLHLLGAKRVTSITLHGNNNETLTGSAMLDYTTLEIEMTGGTSNSSLRSITIDCGDGVALSPSSDTEFYFVLAPQTFTKGITIDIEFEDGTTITKSTTKSLTISRNHIQPMKAVDTLDESIDASSMPLITTYPDVVYDDETDDIVVLINGKDSAIANYTGSIYAHTGLITSSSTSTSDWKYVKAGWTENTEACKLTYRGDNIWQFVIKGGVRSFYNVNDSDEIRFIAFVFRSSDGSKELKDNGNDILVPVSKRDSEKEQLISTSPRTIDEDMTRDIIVTINTSGTTMDGFTGDIYAHTGVLTDKSSSTSDWRYVKANWTTNLEECRLKSIGDNKWQLTITGGPRAFYKVPSNESIEYLAFVFRSSNGNVELKDNGKDILVYVENELSRRPLGAEYGVTIQGTSATFMLYAPGKSSVHLLGDFNNYSATSASKMKRDGDDFWITIDNLVAGKEYGYQYLIDNSIRVGDPYSEMILDPWNDKYIGSAYPNLKSYPSNTSDIVSVFEIAPEPYKWSIANFDRPAKNSLAIYELHIRDFTNEGTIKAAAAKLDYLKTLGINAIELMPIQEFDGNDSWGYNPCFYFAPDKAYGTKDDYKYFIDECHKRGIAVILDIVINHATGLFPWAKMWWDSGNNVTSNDNPFFNVYAPHDFSVYHDFNHLYPMTRKYFKDVLQYWLYEYKIDGYRFDLAKGLVQNPASYDAGGYSSERIGIIKEYADAIRAVEQDAYIILEHFCDYWEEQELANYRDILLWNNQCNPFYQTVMGYDSDSNFYDDFAWGRVSYPESHDEERQAYKAITWGNSYVKSDWSRISKHLQGIYCLHFLTPYPKMMWQFGELAYDYSIEYNGRTGHKPVCWSYYNDTNRRALYDAMSKAISWRTSHEQMYSYDGVSPTLHVGDDSFGGKHLIYSTDHGSVIVVCNFRNEHISFDISVPKSGTWRNLMTGSSVTLGSKYTVSLNGGDYIVLVKD